MDTICAGIRGLSRACSDTAFARVTDYLLSKFYCACHRNRRSVVLKERSHPSEIWLPVTTPKTIRHLSTIVVADELLLLSVFCGSSLGWTLPSQGFRVSRNSTTRTLDNKDRVSVVTASAQKVPSAPVQFSRSIGHGLNLDVLFIPQTQLFLGRQATAEART